MFSASLASDDPSHTTNHDRIASLDNKAVCIACLNSGHATAHRRGTSQVANPYLEPVDGAKEAYSESDILLIDTGVCCVLQEREKDQRIPRSWSSLLASVLVENGDIRGLSVPTQTRTLLSTESLGTVVAAVPG